MFHTLLFDAKQGYERLDLCEPCWKAQSHDFSDRKGFISQWQTAYTAPPPAPPEAIQKDTAETLLRKLLVLNDPSHTGALYILGAMLERKRILKVKAQINKNGKRVFVYEHPKSGDLFHIADPNLQLDQLAAVQHDVSSLLEHGLPGINPSTNVGSQQETASEAQPTEEAAPTTPPDPAPATTS
ncbi:MAG: hypothetical protein ACO1QB_00605 [Verrucomicrobiales bacterium]